MHKSISEYADAAVRARALLNKGTPMHIVVLRALEGQGVRNTADQKRLAPQVLSELGRRGA